MSISHQIQQLGNTDGNNLYILYTLHLPEEGQQDWFALQL